MATVRRATGRWISNVYNHLYKFGVLTPEYKNATKAYPVIEKAFDVLEVPASKMSGCCGMIELYGWSHNEAKGTKSLEKAARQRLDHLDNVIKSYGEGKTGKCIQLVLTTPQLTKYPAYKKEFEKRGFKLVSKFRNTTGTICSVFHLTTGESDRMPKKRKNNADV